MRSTLSLVFFTATTSGATATDCYRDAATAFRAGRHAEAGALYAEAADSPNCEESRAGLLLGAAEAYRRRAEETGDNEWSCKASGAYQRASTATTDERLLKIARHGAQATAGYCYEAIQPSEPDLPMLDSPIERAPPIMMPPTPPRQPAQDSGASTAWIIAGAATAAVVGVGLMVLMARDDEAPERRLQLNFVLAGE